MATDEVPVRGVVQGFMIPYTPSGVLDYQGADLSADCYCSVVPLGFDGCALHIRHCAWLVGGVM